MIALFLALAAAGVCAAARYPAEGLVLRVNPADRTVLISHRAIEGFMPAMAMSFRVRRAKEIAALTPGERVTFDLVVSKRASWIERVRAARRETVEDEGVRIPLPSPKEVLAIGAPVPDFTLIDQSGERVRLADLAGKVVALDFIYTRCPLPEVCPRLSANFAQVQRRFADHMGKDLVLLSLTLDPQYDTTATLAAYAKIWNAERAGWRFLTGDPATIERAAGWFGLIFWPEEGLITHTSETGVIGRDGRLAARISGSGFTGAQIGDLIARQLEDR